MPLHTISFEDLEVVVRGKNIKTIKYLVDDANMTLLQLNLPFGTVVHFASAVVGQSTLVCLHSYM